MSESRCGSTTTNLSFSGASWPLSAVSTRTVLPLLVFTHSRAHPGIRFLENAHIVHRDISAGNVLLTMRNPAPGHEGFITDFEFAKLPDDVLSNLGQQHPRPEMTVSSDTSLYCDACS